MDKSSALDSIDRLSTCVWGFTPNAASGAVLITGIACSIIGSLALASVVEWGMVAGALLTASGVSCLVGVALVTVVRVIHYGYRQRHLRKRGDLLPQDSELQNKLNALVGQSKCHLAPEDTSAKEKELNLLCHLALTDKVKSCFKNPPASMDLIEIPEGMANYADNADAFAGLFKQHQSNLADLLREKTSRILQGGNPKQLLKEYQLTSKQVRALLLFIKSHPDLKNNLRTGLLEEAFKDYRTYAILHLRPGKVCPWHSRRLRLLLKATWFHGTPAVAGMEQSEYTLIPAGLQQEAGTVSFFGENQVGIVGKKYLNQTRISGTRLEHTKWSMEYAEGFDRRGESYDWIPERLTIRIQELKESYWEANNSFQHSAMVQATNSFCQLALYIRRWQIWDQEGFQQQKKNLEEILGEITKYLPDDSKIILRSFSAPDGNSYSYTNEDGKKVIDRYVANFEDSLERLNQALDWQPKPLTQAQKRAITDDTFPALLGSTTLLSTHISKVPGIGACDSREYMVEGCAQIGRDLQLFCVPGFFESPSDSIKARKWLKQSGLSSHVQPFTFADVRKAAEIYKKKQPYLQQILSPAKTELVAQ